MVSRVITATMLFLQCILYSSSFVGTLKNEIPEAALELCQLKLKQFSSDSLKFSTKHEDNPFTLNCFHGFSHLFVVIFDAGSRRLGSNNFRSSSYKEKTDRTARVSRLSFRFLWLCLNQCLWNVIMEGSLLNKFCLYYWARSKLLPINIQTRMIRVYH